ncbi:MAG: GntR family transcriptional regulator [Desulfatiglandaceae bacterium]
MKNLVIRQNKTIRQKVYEHLREAILNCEIKPGERLVETDLANRIGVSRTPVREALHTLEREGLVEALHRVGYVVRPISKDEVSELCGIRLALEGVALRWALQKAPSELTEVLRKNVILCQQRLDAGDVKAFVGLDAQFHDLISRVAGSKRLMEMTQRIRRSMLRYRIQSIYSEDNVIRAITGHKAILEAIEKGDARAAQSALRAHIRQSRKDILYFGFREQKPMTS